jgi:predicted O-methyltransferase YrrM
MQKYVGDLSKQDAALLERYASNARTVLEFGVGGSTQVIAQSIPIEASFTSLDTSPAWIETTRLNLRRLGVEGRCRLIRYEDWAPGESRFDVVFDDGAGPLRRDFALRSFPLLEVGGVLLFHDTRRASDVCNVLAVVEHYFEEVACVRLNERVDGASSNITVVEKKAREPYVNWNVAEGRPPWAYGQAAVPEDFWSK